MYLFQQHWSFLTLPRISLLGIQYSTILLIHRRNIVSIYLCQHYCAFLAVPRISLLGIQYSTILLIHRRLYCLYVLRPTPLLLPYSSKDILTWHPILHNTPYTSQTLLSLCTSANTIAPSLHFQGCPYLASNAPQYSLYIADSIVSIYLFQHHCSFLTHPWISLVRGILKNEKMKMCEF